MEERVTASSCSHSPKTFEDVTKLLSVNLDKFLNPDIKCSDVCDNGIEKLWMCLDCGFVGCGHYDNYHSTEHYKRSAHPLVMQLKTYTIWCFSCNVFVNVSKFPEFVLRKYKEFGRRSNLNLSVYGQLSIQAVKPEAQQKQYKLYSLELNVPGEVPIVNSNSTCYAAAVLQALAHLSYFNRWFWALAAYIYQGSFATEEECLQDILTSHFCYMMQVLQLPGKMNQIYCHFEAEKIHMQPFYRSLYAYNKQFIGDKQYDAQEFLMVIFDCVRHSLNRRFVIRQAEEKIYYSQQHIIMKYIYQQIVSEKRDIISDCFEGIEVILKEYKCQSCNSQLYSQEKTPFCMLSLNVTKNQTTLEPSLQKYCAYQQNEVGCKSCQCYSHMMSQTKFLYCPPVLCIHLLCFENEEEKIHTSFTQYSLEEVSLFNYLSDYSIYKQDFQGEDELQQLYKSLLSYRFAYAIAEYFYLRSNNKQYNQIAFNWIIEPLMAFAYNLPESIYIALKTAYTCKVLPKIVPKSADSHEAKIFYILECMASEYYDLAKFNYSKTEYFKELLQGLSACKNMKNLRTYSQDELAAGSYLYELRCAVLHNGTLRSGHYTACCRAQQGWLLFDDANIKNMQEVVMKEPYLLFYYKKRTIAQEIVSQDIYQQILSHLSGQPCAKVCQDMYESFFRYAIYYIYTFGQQLKFKLSDCSISGDWLYRLHQLPWARNMQFHNLDERLHQYAIQPSMVPCKVPVSGFLWYLIVSVFGDSGIEEDCSVDYKKAQKLFDDIISYNSVQYPQYAVSRIFVKELSEHCFYYKNKPTYCNYDLIEPGAPLQRMKLRKGLKEHDDYVIIGQDEWREIKQTYGGLELQMWQRDNIYGLPEELE